MASMCRLCVCCVEFLFYRINDFFGRMACVLAHTNICVNLLIICMHSLCLLCRPVSGQYPPGQYPPVQNPPEQNPPVPISPRTIFPG